MFVVTLATPLRERFHTSLTTAGAFAAFVAFACKSVAPSANLLPPSLLGVPTTAARKPHKSNILSYCSTHYSSQYQRFLSFLAFPFFLASQHIYTIVSVPCRHPRTFTYFADQLL
jgi:hypothetical protein